MLQITRALFKIRTIPLFFRCYGDSSQNNIVKVVNDKNEEFIKLTFKMNQNFNFKVSKIEEHRAILNKIKMMSSLQRRKEEIRQSVATKFTGAAQLAVKTEEDVDVCLIRDEVEIDEKATNSEAWINGSFLKIGDVVYEVKCNYPAVLSLSLPEYIVAGCIIRSHVILECAYLFDCDFIWYHNLFGDEVENQDNLTLDNKDTIFEQDQYWSKVGEGVFYQTTENDIGRKLKVACVPKSGGVYGDQFTANTNTVVEKGPGTFPFEERHACTKAFTDEQSIRCVSYNILAKVYVEKKKFPYCSDKSKDIYYRKQLLFKELLGYKSDIICLQEVTERIFDLDLKYVLNSAGYDGFYMRKGGRRYEGLATFFRKDKFRVLNNRGILLNDMLKQKEIFNDLLSKVSGNYKDMSKLLAQDTAYQALMLEDTSSQKRKVLVANTHLYSNKDTPEVRLIQSALCLYYTEHILNSEEAKSTGILFCGDFNSLPSSSAYKFLTSGNFECCPSWKNSKTEPTKPNSDTTLRHNLSLSSACGTPKYTNYTHEFNGCLDYIFYNTNCFSVSEVIHMPSHDKVIEQVGLPNEYFPSDHLALVCTLKWNSLRET